MKLRDSTRRKSMDSLSATGRSRKLHCDRGKTTLLRVEDGVPFLMVVDDEVAATITSKQPNKKSKCSEIKADVNQDESSIADLPSLSPFVNNDQKIEIWNRPQIESVKSEEPVKAKKQASDNKRKIKKQEVVTPFKNVSINKRQSKETTKRVAAGSRNNLSRYKNKNKESNKRVIGKNKEKLNKNEDDQVSAIGQKLTSKSKRKTVILDKQCNTMSGLKKNMASGRNKVSNGIKSVYPLRKRQR